MCMKIEVIVKLEKQKWVWGFFRINVYEELKLL